MHEAFVSASAGAGQAEGGGSTSGWSRLDSSAAASSEPSSTAAAAADSADVIVSSANGAGMMRSDSGGSDSHSAAEVGDSNGSGGNGANDHGSGDGSTGEIVSPSELEALINEAGSAAWGEWASLPPGVQTATGVPSMPEMFCETCSCAIEHALGCQTAQGQHRRCCTAEVTHMLRRTM